jgi:hypothetical protein
MLPNAAVAKFAANALAGDQRIAVFAPKQSTSQRVAWLDPRTFLVPAGQNILAYLERTPINQRSMLAGKVLIAVFDFPDVDAVIEKVRKRRSVESALALLVCETLARQLIGEALEAVLSGCEQLEDTDDSSGLLR